MAFGSLWQRTWVRVLLVLLGIAVLGLGGFFWMRHRPQAAPEPIRAGRLQTAQNLLKSLGILTVDVRIEGSDSTVVFLLDTAKSHLERLEKWGEHWGHNGTYRSNGPDVAPLARLVEILGWHDVRIVAVQPDDAAHGGDVNFVVGPLAAFEWFGFRCDRQGKRIVDARYRKKHVIDKLIDPSWWQEIDRPAAGLRSWPDLLEPSQLDSSLTRWIGQEDHGTRCGLPIGTSLRGQTLILDTAFPRPWCKGLRVGDSTARVRKVLGKESFVQNGLVVYKGKGFTVAVTPEGAILLSALPRRDPSDLLGQILTTWYRGEPIDSIRFYDQLDSVVSDRIYQGPFGLKVVVHGMDPAYEHSVEIQVHTDFRGRLAAPTPVRMGAVVSYLNFDGTVERMASDWAMWTSRQVPARGFDTYSERYGVVRICRPWKGCEDVLFDMDRRHRECVLPQQATQIKLLPNDRYLEFGLGATSVEHPMEDLWKNCR